LRSLTGEAAGVRAMLRLVLAVLMAGPVAAQTLDDRHLPVIPRTEAEAARIARVLAAPTDFTLPEAFEARPGGAATVRAGVTADAFSRPSANMAFDREMTFKLGNALFRKTWVAAPASTLASDGLGPLFNARGCQDCHLKDGRGHAPESKDDGRVSMLMRLSIPGGTSPKEIAEYNATLPDPVYGGQLQDHAVAGQAAEGQIGITYTEMPVSLADGTVVSLRAPSYSLEAPAHGAPAPGLMLSARVAPQMIGLGLLEAIPAADILSREDPGDADGDGISGRAQVVMSAEYGVPMLGRFGVKAGKPTLREQSAGAFAGDMGLSSRLAPAPSGDCTSAQGACLAAPNGAQAIHGGHEVSDEALEMVTFYARNLGVPERRGVDDPAVLRGKAVFHDLNCSGCHTPKHVTHRLEGQPEQSFQLIWPHTDLLLHDMGPGLADNRPEARASGREWRTPPLWGIGLTAQVSGHTQFLHDGRARSLIEALLWHGGEAQAARDGVVALGPDDRAALIAYLESL
jgi:CxxC motif-containing protein (DUF1111 family)